MRGELGVDDGAYRRLLKQLRVYRAITGFTGNECTRLLRRAADYVALVGAHPQASALLKLMKEFDSLYSDIENPRCSPEVWAARANVFGCNMVMEFGELMPQFIYLHVFVCHVPEWAGANGGLQRWSTHGLEGVNKCMKMEKHEHSTRDKLEDDVDGPQHNQQQLIQMVIGHNRRAAEVLLESRPHSRAPYECTRCHEVGHNCRTCPAAP